MKQMIYSLLCATLLFVSSTQAAEEANRNSYELSQEEQSAILEQREIKETERLQLLAAVEGEDSLTLAESSPLEESPEGESVSNSAYYTTSHMGAFHFAIAVPYDGSHVELEDGSVWKVKYGDRWKMRTWYSDEQIVLVYNDVWFPSLTSYNFKLINLANGDQVEVYKHTNSNYYCAFTKQLAYRYDNSYAVIGIDGTIRLTDGSIWSVPVDQYTTNWIPNDIIFIGINDMYDSYVMPNLLFNMNDNSCAKGSCINGY